MIAWFPKKGYFFRIRFE